MSNIAVTVETSFWRDLAIHGASSEARTLFAVLVSSPTISLAGVDSLVPARWATLTGHRVEVLDAALDELEQLGFVSADRETAEIHVFAFPRWNRGRLLGQSVRDFLGPVVSDKIRNAVLGR